MSIDYKPIQVAYTCGRCNSDGKRVYPSLAQLAQEYSVSLSSLQHHAASDGWLKQRQQTEERIVMDAIRRYEDEMSAKLAQVDKLASDAAIAMLQVIVTELEQAVTKEERRALVSKYAKMLPDLLSTAHTAIGIEQMLDGATIRREDAA